MTNLQYVIRSMLDPVLVLADEEGEGGNSIVPSNRIVHFTGG